MGNEVSQPSRKDHKGKSRDDKSHKSSRSHKSSKSHHTSKSHHHSSSKSANKDHHSHRTDKDQAKADKAKAKKEKERAEQRLRHMYVGCEFMQGEPRPDYIRLKKYDKDAISTAAYNAGEALEMDFENRLRQDLTFDPSAHLIWQTMTKKQRERFKGVLDEEGRLILRKNERALWKKGELLDAWAQRGEGVEYPQEVDEEEYRQQAYMTLTGGEPPGSVFNGSDLRSPSAQSLSQPLDEVSDGGDDAGEGRALPFPASVSDYPPSVSHASHKSSSGHKSSHRGSSHRSSSHVGSSHKSSHKSSSHKSSSHKSSSHKSSSGHKSSSHRSSSRMSKK